MQTDADRELLAANGSVPIGIGKNTHIKRAIIDKNARIGDNVKVTSCNNLLSVQYFVTWTTQQTF